MWIASAPVSLIRKLASRRLQTPIAVVLGALILRLLCGVGFANYDTLYALAWGGQLARGEVPAYGVKIAPTPHPLVELLGVVLTPLSARTIENVVVALGFLALAGCGWVIYRLGREWLGKASGAFAALILLTRVPLLSYGTRAYIDVPYLLLVLCALLVETRRRRAGTPVLVLLALAGLLRPEAWVFSALYWVYLTGWLPRRLRKHQIDYEPPLGRRQLFLAALLAASAPLVWIVSDLLITGDALWSLVNTRHTAQALSRVSGPANAVQYIPRRIGEILRVPVLVGAAFGGIASLVWLRDRVRLGAGAGVLAVLVFAAFASAGLPIDTRYAFLTAAILCLFCGAGAFGWLALERGSALRRWWLIGGVAVTVAVLAYMPSQYRSANHELSNLQRQQRIQNDLLALVEKKAITLRCGPVEVPNHAPIPLLALYLKASPARIVSAQSTQISSGTFIDPANAEVQNDYILDPNDPPPREVTPPPGFKASATSRSWLIFEKC